MTQERCSACRQSKPIADFNRLRSARDGLQPICRECNTQKARDYDARHREARIRVIMARKAVQRQIALAAVGDHLLDHPCIDCGEADVRVLDFDHRENCDETAEVMKLVQDGYGLLRIMAEIDKCDVRCRNCHAKVTCERMGDNGRSGLMRRAGDDGLAS
ncbi:hypothetical protein ACFWGP_15310 [Agromyces sp. NPDC127015]|uniref:hypothetical protein n=1 Tax=Agromyces sp. NPDC127015 TaxID=3347108 RepID=UPI00365F625F